MKANCKNFGDYLRLRRAKKNLTLRELYAITGVTISMLSDMESGRRDPRLRTIEKLAHGYGETVPKFLSRYYSLL